MKNLREVLENAEKGENVNKIGKTTFRTFRKAIVWDREDEKFVYISPRSDEFQEYMNNKVKGFINHLYDIRGIKKNYGTLVAAQYFLSGLKPGRPHSVEKINVSDIALMESTEDQQRLIAKQTKEELGEEMYLGEIA